MTEEQKFRSDQQHIWHLCRELDEKWTKPTWTLRPSLCNAVKNNKDHLTTGVISCY